MEEQKKSGSGSLIDHLKRIRALNTEAQKEASRQNGKRPVKEGSRPRGRPIRIEPTAPAVNLPEQRLAFIDFWWGAVPQAFADKESRCPSIHDLRLIFETIQKTIPWDLINQDNTGIKYAEIDLSELPSYARENLGIVIRTIESQGYKVKIEKDGE